MTANFGLPSVGAENRDAYMKAWPGCFAKASVIAVAVASDLFPQSTFILLLSLFSLLSV